MPKDTNPGKPTTRRYSPDEKEHDGLYRFYYVGHRDKEYSVNL